MKQVIFCIHILFTLTLLGQRYDSKWVMGYDADASNIPYETYEMVFTSQGMNQIWQDYQANFGTTRTAMYDSLGNLLFCTNGIHIWNPNRDTMENGSGLSPSDYTTSWWEYGLYIPQGVIALPAPNTPNVYYLLHETAKWTDTVGLRPTELYYSEINMNENGGLGKVTVKNQVLLNDTLDTGQITACKHGNGRDYWVLAPRYSGDGYHYFLVQPTGISYEGFQKTGNRMLSSCASEAVFSPDGTLYVRYDAGTWTDNVGNICIFDFDRCTGMLSNQRLIPVQIDANMGDAAGCAISANSKFLYFSTLNKLYQYDLTASNIGDSQYFVSEYDVANQPDGSRRFYQAQLAPDGKIYWSCTSSQAMLYVINSPDSLGAACNFSLQGVTLLSYNAFGLPNHPNYYLGAKVGSACDSLSLSNEVAVSSKQVKIYPNPANDKVIVSFDEMLFEGNKLLINNSLGVEVLRKSLAYTTQQVEIDISTLSDGIYYLHTTHKGKIYTTKFVVQH